VMQCPIFARPRPYSQGNGGCKRIAIASVQSSAISLECFASGGTMPPLPKEFA
jgi:hypothetical protein